MFGKPLTAVAGAVMLSGALFTIPAHAQTATNLNCNKCVGTRDIALQAVNKIRLKNGAVTASKLATGSVRTGKIFNEAVTSQKLAPNAVTASKIAPNAVTASKIAPNAVTASKIAPGVIGTGELTDASVTPAKLATPDGVAFTPGTVSDTSITVAETVRTLTITLPGPGSVIVFASGYYRSSDATTQGACSITKGATVNFTFEIHFGGNAIPAGFFRVPFAGTRGYDEAAGGPVTYNLVCEEFSG